MENFIKEWRKQINRQRVCVSLLCLGFLVMAGGCSASNPPKPVPMNTVSKADSFAYPVGKSTIVTQAKDSADDWYNAQDFEENNHLGEDWNKNSGGNTDCGEPVYASANGRITYAEHAGPGWGNVIIIEHALADSSKVQTLYGHLQTIIRKKGAVMKREKIGTVGNADGKYLCHLHFELRDENSLLWNRVGPGYSPIRYGWLDPSDFIDRLR